MTKTIHFNTGRKYTANGQRITATLHDDGVVTFFDHDRMVHGELIHNVPEHLFSERVIMGAYDNMKTTNSSRAWNDGMSRGGCNSKYEG